MTFFTREALFLQEIHKLSTNTLEKRKKGNLSTKSYSDISELKDN